MLFFKRFQRSVKNIFILTKPLKAFDKILFILTMIVLIFLKSVVYNDRLRTIHWHKNNIRQATANIPINLLKRDKENFGNRVFKCIDSGSRHLTDVISKKKSCVLP